MLTVISAGSVHLVNQAREDARAVVHTVEVENQISLVQLQLRRAESAQRGYLSTLRPDFQTDFERAVSELTPALTTVEPAHQRQSGSTALHRRNACRSTISGSRNSATTIELARTQRMTTPPQIVREGIGRDAMNHIDDLAGRMRAEEDRLFAERTTNADRSQTLAASMTGIGSGFVVVLARHLDLPGAALVARARRRPTPGCATINLNLEATIDERTADLREANDEIQRFAYIVSHDLRSPLVNIMGFTSELEELRGDIFKRIAALSRAQSAAPPVPENATDTAEPALEGADKQLSEDFSEALGFIKSSIGKMDRLIIGDPQPHPRGTARVRAGPDRHPRTDRGHRHDGGASGRRSAGRDPDRPLPSIVSDRLALEQIFSNLIDNALKYLKTGVPGDITVRGRTKLGFAIFEITDNGRGIDPKDHQRIFDLFRRAGTQDKPGQGIGLAHVRALVRRLGGTMSVASELHQGSTFTITLPINWTASNRNTET